MGHNNYCHGSHPVLQLTRIFQKEQVMPLCKKAHRASPTFRSLPRDQGGDGRHKCAACAYERGLEQGSRREESITLGLESLHESQAGTVRHKSPHAAWAMGYLEGVRRSYQK